MVLTHLESCRETHISGGTDFDTLHRVKSCLFTLVLPRLCHTPSLPQRKKKYRSLSAALQLKQPTFKGTKNYWSPLLAPCQIKQLYNTCMYRKLVNTETIPEIY